VLKEIYMPLDHFRKPLLVCLLVILSIAGYAQDTTRDLRPAGPRNSGLYASSQNVQVAELHPLLQWRRVVNPGSPLEGPVLYQLLFSASGTPFTVAMFDTNPRHLTNTPITVNGSNNVVIGGAGGMSINGATGIVTFANGQTFPGTAGVNSVTQGNNFITIGGTAANPTVGLNTSNTDARYLQLSGGVVTGPVGFGATPNSQSFIDINGTQTEVSNNEVLLRIDGTLNSSPGNSYSTALAVYPTTTMTGYTNYNKGIDVVLASTGGSIAHSVVAVNVNQPSAVNGSDCVVSFGINVPNQSAPCSTPQPTRNYGFFENGAAGTMNYFANNVGIGTATPDAALSVNGTADKTGSLSWAAFSDGRLKNVLGSFSAGLAEVLRLNPIRYRYKEQNALGIRDAEEHVGFVAQDVQKVIPEAVTTNDRGYLLVTGDPILWAMLNAIKEQQAVIEKQHDQIHEQLAALAKIRSTMARQQKSARQQEVRLRTIELKLERLSAGETQLARFPASQAGDPSRSPVSHGR
jgi:hypothetical protein